MIKMTLEEWRAEAVRRFGADAMAWRFVCPSCKHVASVADYRAAGAPEGAVAFSCIGRYVKGTATIFEEPGPCNYTGGGLFKMNPVHVTDLDGIEREVFAFADVEQPAAAVAS